jgi:hypothetical protein
MRGTVYFCVGMPEVRIVLTALRGQWIWREVVPPRKKSKINNMFTLPHIPCFFLLTLSKPSESNFYLIIQISQEGICRERGKDKTILTGVLLGQRV